MGVSIPALSIVVMLIGISTVNAETVDTIKRNYELVFENVQVDYLSSEYFQGFEIRLVRHNNTAPLMLCASIKLIKDLPSNLDFGVRAKERIGNSISNHGFDMKPKEVCAAMVNYRKYYNLVLAVSNLRPTCPIVKGDYWVKDFVIHTEGLPPVLPGNAWKVFMDMSIGGKNIGIISSGFTIDRSKGFSLFGK